MFFIRAQGFVVGSVRCALAGSDGTLSQASQSHPVKLSNAQPFIAHRRFTEDRSQTKNTRVCVCERMFLPALRSLLFSHTSSFIVLQFNIIVFTLFCQWSFPPAYTHANPYTRQWAERLTLAGCVQYLLGFRGEIVRFSMYLSLLNDCSFPARRRRDRVE